MRSEDSPALRSADTPVLAMQQGFKINNKIRQLCKGVGDVHQFIS